MTASYTTRWDTTRRNASDINRSLNSPRRPFRRHRTRRMNPLFPLSIVAALAAAAGLTAAALGAPTAGAATGL